MTNPTDYNTIISSLSDLSASILAKESLVLSLPSSDMTALEKTLVCVAMYWLKQNVVELQTMQTCTRVLVNPFGSKVVHTLTHPNSGNRKIVGSEIGAFWEACTTHNIGIKSTETKRHGRESCTIWNPWCAVFAGFLWIEALTNLQTNKYFDVIHNSYGRVKTKFDTNGEDNSFIGRLIKYAGAGVALEPSVGNFFFRQTGTGGHCGLVVKIDRKRKTYCTIEGNTVIDANGNEGVGAKEYDFDETVDGYKMQFVSVRNAGLALQNSQNVIKFDGNEYSFSSIYRPYFDMTCWPEPPTQTTDNPVPPQAETPPVLEETPPNITCPEGKTMYGFSPVRANDARDSEDVSTLKIAELEKEYWDKYNLNLHFNYDIESDTYWACGDNRQPLVEQPPPCPAGEVRDKDGNCRKNVPNVTCCDISLKVPSNPMEMLPITALRKANNEVGNLNQDILLDIITERKLEGYFPQSRLKSTHGVAMGLLNPNADTGQSTGFGMFKGMGAIGTGLNDNGVPPVPVYMIGYKGALNFASAILKGLAGAVDTKPLGDITPSGIATMIEHDEASHVFMDWVYAQERAGAFELIELRAEEPQENLMWQQFTEVDYPRGKQKNGSPTDHFAQVFVVNHDNRSSRLSKKLLEEAQKSSSPLEIGQYINWFEETFWSWDKHRWHGISGSFDELLEIIDNINRREGAPNRVTLIVLDKARLTRRPVWSDVMMAIQVLASVGGSLVGMGDVAGGLVKKVGQYLTALATAFGAIDSFKNVIEKKGGSNWVSGLSNGFIEMTKAATMLAPDTVKGIWDSAKGTTVSKLGLDAFFDDFTKAIGYSNDKGNIYNVIGSRLGEVSNYLGLTKMALTKANTFFEAKMGLKYEDLKYEYEKLTVSIDKNINLISAIAKRPGETKDLNDSLAYLENIKNMFFSAAVTDFFNPRVKDIWQYTLNLQSVGGDFLNNNLIRSAFMKVANGGLASSIPGLDTIMGVALGVNAAMGGGHEMVLNKYGADTLFAMIKTAYGIPTTAGEFKDLIKDAFALEFNVGDYGSQFKEQQEIIIPSYVDDEIRECIVCDFTKNNIPMTVCQDGMQYNYLTGKCDYMTFNGIEPQVCYDVCKNITTPSSLPAQIKECEGTYYYDISLCNSNGNILTKDAVTNAIDASAGMLVAGAASALLSDRTILNDTKNICDCFGSDTTNLEKQFVCEASLHISKKGDCSNDAFLKEMDSYIKATHKIEDGQSFDCGKNWCALFAAYCLLKASDNIGVDLELLKKTLTGYNWAVRFLVRDLLKNGIGEQSLEPRVGAIFFSGSYINSSYDHIGIVACVDIANNKFQTIEGNVAGDDGVPSVRIVEYDYSEIATDLIDTNNTDFSYSATAKFGKHVRFIHLNENGGVFDATICGCNSTNNTGDITSQTPTCITKKDCVENNKNRRYAVFTTDGWYVHSGEGFGKYKANKWLKLKDGVKCEFIEVKCNEDNESQGGGCDCKTLQDKLDSLKNDIEQSTNAKYKDIIAKIENIPVTADNKDILLLLKDLIDDVKKGVLVALNDGDDNTIIDNKTTEILLLIAELRELLQEMKYCNNPELVSEIQDLVASITKELHSRRDSDIKNSRGLLSGLSEESAGSVVVDANTTASINATMMPEHVVNTDSQKLFSTDTFSRNFDNNKTLNEVALVEEDWYDATIDRLLYAVDMARNTLYNCSCEEINTPNGNSVVNNYYENDCPACGGNGNMDITPETTEHIIERITERINEVVTNETTNNIVEKIIERLPEINLKCEGNNCPAYTPETLEPVIKTVIEQLNPEVVVSKPEQLEPIIERVIEKIPVKIGADEIEKIKEIIRETPIEVKCEGANCKDYDAQFDELKMLLRNIKDGETTIINGDTINAKIDEIKNFISNTKLEVDAETLVPIINKSFTEVVAKSGLTENNLQLFNNNFERIIEKTINKDCDNSEVMNAISKLRNDFNIIINEAKEIQPKENNNAELKELFTKILNKIDNIRIPSTQITTDNKELLLEINKFKTEITDKINFVFSKQNDIQTKLNDTSVTKQEYDTDTTHEHRNSNECPKCGLDYSNCKCPKIVEEKIDRQIVFDYAKDGERSPLHEHN